MSYPCNTATPTLPCRTSTAWPTRQWQLAFITTILNIRRPTFQLRHHGSRGAYGSVSRRFRKDSHGLRRAACAWQRRRPVSKGSFITTILNIRRPAFHLPLFRHTLRVHRVGCGSGPMKWTNAFRVALFMRRHRRPALGGSNNRRQSTRRHTTSHNTIVVRLAARRETAVGACRFSLETGLC